MTQVPTRKNAQRANSKRKFFVIAAAGLILAAGAAGTFLYKFNTSDATIAEGNTEFAAQQYDAALEKYESAQQSASIFAEPFYNAANALYKQGKFQEAQAQLEQALTRTNDKIAEFLQFNLGNVAFNAEQFEQAIARYEEALRLNPDDKDAKYNLELALLQKQQQDQQQQQNQDQRNQDQQNQNQQNQDQQNQDQQNQDQQNQQGGQQNQDQQNHQNGQQQQGQQNPQQTQQNDQQGQQQPNAQNQQNGQQDPNAQQQQQQGNGAAGQATDEQGNEQGQAYVPGELTQEQAEQLLAAVGGNSQTLLEKLQMYFYATGDEPEKDW